MARQVGRAPPAGVNGNKFGLWQALDRHEYLHGEPDWGDS